jgi:nanoRNase/pAp phosphatase (c-di-AMP/oligoRNAs hydrolase)
MQDLLFLDSLKGRRAAFTFHSQGDVDGVASAFALKMHFGNSIVLPVDRINAQAKRLLDYVGFALDKPPQKYDALVVVDCNSKILLGNFASEKAYAVLDHHVPHADAPAAQFRFVDPSYSSACEIVYEYLRSKSKSLDHRVAFLLACGIITDSANFRHANARTFKYMAELLEHAQMDYLEILDILDKRASLAQRKEVLRACQSAKISTIGDFVVATAVSKGFEASVAEALLELGADVSFVGCATKDARISARSLHAVVAKVKLTEIMGRAGKVLGGSGGGHPGAAGADGPRAKRLDEALEMCGKLAMERLGKR